MEWAVWTTSSDSEDAMTQEKNEEEGSPSNRDQQDSLYGAGEQSTTKDAQGYVGLTFVKEAAATGNGWDSMDPAKAEAGKKPSDKDTQDLIHFEKQQGIKRYAPDSMGSTRTVNISEGAGIPDCEPENIPMRMMNEEEDEEQVLVTQEDLGESAEELEFDSSNSTNEVRQKRNPGRSDVQRKKRNLTEDGLGQASKLVKRSEPPQENQLPCASTKCGESASDPSCSQWKETFQSKHLGGNITASEPVNCTEVWSHSSEWAANQEVHTEKWKYHCAECNTTCRNVVHLNRHRLINHQIVAPTPYECPECNKCFVTANTMSKHRLRLHNVEKPYLCTECNLTFSSIFFRSQHHHTADGTEKSFKCPECNNCFVTEKAMSMHRLRFHNHNGEKCFQCTKCNLTFNSLFFLKKHSRKAHTKERRIKCPECKKRFVTADGMSEHRHVFHCVEKPYQCTECNLTFNSSLLRYQHHHTVHGTEKCFKCPECKEHFPSKSSLNKHLLHTVH